ncbi:hypothetical protein BDQ12DRAFT_691745 [Crucibulum laeve]|uniref:PAS domain-containing protein n=1 Tax=Crucibulum laeve TaxID=68775 RepID=A0A5C3LL75_9AGAR|nr:hypothetical protein BDQ12DRAFT_691745 [Crucibulum laeve]
MANNNVSFIGIVDFSQEARWLYMSSSVTELLGFEPRELIGQPSLELVHPDEFPRIRQLHYDTITQDKAAVLVYLRMRHKDPYKGYILCGVSRTVVHDVLVGSVSFASPAKALHNASTAQEITVITPSASNFEFRRWGDPSPMPPCPIPRGMMPGSPSPSSSSWGSGSSTRSESRSPSPEPHAHNRDAVITFGHLPNKSFRTAFILDRFTLKSTILYCSNDLILSTTRCMGRSFYDFVAKKDEDFVIQWVDCVKGWGVNERGQPSDGGFGFGRFSLLTEGRDSNIFDRVPEPEPTTRGRNGSVRGRGARSGRANQPQRRPISPSELTAPKITVDAIFSAHSDGLMVILRRAA